MERLISIIEIVGILDSEQVCAAADADYDEASQQVTIALSSFVRSPQPGEAALAQEWLPPRATVKEHLPRNEVSAFTKDVFASWANRVRRAIPQPVAG